MKADIGEARNSATWPMSSSVPQRPSGVRRSVASYSAGSSRVTRVSLLSTKPGAMPFTRMPSRPQASASVFTRVSRPPFDAL